MLYSFLFYVVELKFIHGNGVAVLAARRLQLFKHAAVLQHALELNHRVIIVINKIDKPDARLGEVEDEILELLIDLNASDEQLDSPMLYCSGRAGTATEDPDVPGTDLKPLFEKIIDYMPSGQGI